MKTISKTILIIVMFLLLVGITSTETFAIGKEKGGHSEEYIEIDGEIFYIWRDTKYGFRAYLYFLEEDLGKQIEEVGGVLLVRNKSLKQPVYLPIDNLGNPYNVDLLKTEAAALKMFKIPANRKEPTNLDLRYEKSVSNGGMGKSYTTTYPSIPEMPSYKVGKKNYHFKIEQYDAFHKRFRDYGNLYFLFQGQEGNFRSGLGRNDAGQHISKFPAGYFSNEKNGIDFPYAGRNYVDTEVIEGSVPTGAYTWKYKAGGVPVYERIRTFSQYVLVYPDILPEMQKLTGNYDDFYTNFKSADENSKMWFEMSSQHNPPSRFASGQSTLAFWWWSNGKKRYSYSSQFTPAYSVENNISFYDMSLHNIETGEELSFEEVSDSKYGLMKKYDIASNIEKIKVKWSYGYEDQVQENMDVESLNSDICTNLYLESKDGVYVEQQALVQGSNKGKMKGFFMIDWAKYYELMNTTGFYMFDELQALYPNQIVIVDESRLNNYEFDISVDSLSKEGYITSNTPYNRRHYAETYYDEILFQLIYADNSNTDKRDEMGRVLYEKVAPPQKDIRIKNITGFGTWNDTLKKYVVAPGQTYNATIEVENNGEISTEKPNPAITWNTDKYTITAEVRSNDSNRTSPTNPRLLDVDSEDTLKYSITVRVPSDAKHDEPFNLGVAIHSQEDSFDNYFIISDDFKEIKGVVKEEQGNADIGIKDIILKSGSTTYNTIDASGTYKFDPDIQNYTMEIIVEKLAGDAPVTNPQVELFWQVDADSSDAFNPIVTVSGTLTTVGQTLSYNQNVHAYEQYLYFRASINDAHHQNTTPRTNVDNDNDTKEKTYGSGQDFQVSDVIVSPEKLYIPTGDTTIHSGGTVTAKINTISYGAGTFDNVQVTLNSPVLNETKTISLSTGVDYVSFNLPDRSYSGGNYAFKVTVNGNRAFKEATYENNIGNATLQVKSTIDNIPPYCNGTYTYTSNTWEKRHTIVERNKNWTVCCSKYSGCRRCCKGSTRYFDANPYPKTYNERLDLSTYGASNKTNWSWQRGAIEVNAGRAFEIKWELRYQTNRNQYPRTEDKLDNGQCGGGDDTFAIEKIAHI